MAEAHAAVAFSFTVDHEGVDFQVNHDALWAIWHSGVVSWKKRMGRMRVSGKKYAKMCDTDSKTPPSWLSGFLQLVQNEVCSPLYSM